MTNHWVDIKNTDLAIIMGGNAAEAHPCGFKWVTEALEHRKAKLIVVDPRFTRSAAIADVYAPIRVGTDIAFLGGVINYLLSNNKIHQEYVKAYTNASFLIKDEFAFNDGYFSGYDADKRTYDKSSWGYQMGADGYRDGRRDAGESALRVPADEDALLRATRRRWSATSAARRRRQFLKVCEHDRIDRDAGPRDDDPVRARLDAAFGRLAEHPHDGDDPAAARQHGPRGRRRQRAARPRERAGHHRHVRLLRSAAGLPVGADRRRRHAREVQRRAHAEAAASEPDELSGRTSRSGTSACRRPGSAITRPRRTTSRTT